MKYYTLRPKSTLANYVRYFWVLECPVSENQPYIHRTFANGCPELLFHYKGRFEELAFNDKTESSFIAGIHAQTNQYRRFIVKQDFGIVGVYLYPYAVHFFFKIPSTEICNQLPDLQSLLGAEGKIVEDQIMTARNNNDRIRIVSDFLESKLTKPEHPQIILATKSILQAQGQLSIDQLADSCCLSKRQFERKFKEQCGFSPKSFSRIVRFNSLVANYQKGDYSLTEIAHDFGYYDQSHFIQDFKEFSGYNPKTYFSGKAHEAIYAQ